MEDSGILLRLFFFGFFLYVVKLIHESKLKIGSSWYLMLLSLCILVFSTWPKTISKFLDLTGTGDWVNNLLFLLVILLLFLVLHTSLVISGLLSRVKELAQESSLLMFEVDHLKKRMQSKGETVRP